MRYFRSTYKTKYIVISPPNGRDSTVEKSEAYEIETIKLVIEQLSMAGG